LPSQALYAGLEATALGSLPELLPRDIMVLHCLCNTTKQGAAWEPYCPGAAQDPGPSSGVTVLGPPIMLPLTPSTFWY